MTAFLSFDGWKFQYLLTLTLNGVYTILVVIIYLIKFTSKTEFELRSWQKLFEMF